jgi:hypothetical protein
MRPITHELRYRVELFLASMSNAPLGTDLIKYGEN